MSHAEVTRREGPLAKHASKPRISCAISLLDNWLVRTSFGSALPLFFVAIAWDLRMGPGDDEDRGPWFHPLEPSALSLVAVLSLAFLIWSFAQPRSRFAARVFAPLLSLGVGMAAGYAAWMTAGWVSHLPRVGSMDSSDAAFACILLALPATAALTCAVFFRQAALAWKHGVG